MTWLTLLAALGLDYYRPLARPTSADDAMARLAAWLRDHFNAGSVRHGWLAWAVGALLPAAIVGMFAGLLQHLAAPLLWAVAVAFLYYASGFRQVTQTAADLVGALLVHDMDRAQRFCGDWCAGLAPDADAEALARRAIGQVFRLALARLFGIIFWYACFGLFGALLYVLSRCLAEHWRSDDTFGRAANEILYWLDWLPARALAFSFAIVGNFDQALAGWRALPPQTGNLEVVVAAGGGALGVRLGEPLAEIAPGHPTAHWDAPSPEYLDGAVNLVWRALLLWLAILFLVWLVGH